MKGSYKVALLIAAGLLVIVLGYYISQDRDAAPPRDADVADPLAISDGPRNGEAAETGEVAGRGRPPATSAPPTTPPATDPADATPAPAPPSSDPFLDSLRQSIAAANSGAANQGADAAETRAAETSETPGAANTQAAPPTTTIGPPNAGALARANDGLGLPSGAATGDPLTRAPLPGAARPVPSTTGTPPTTGTQPAQPTAAAPTNGGATVQPPRPTQPTQSGAAAARPADYTIKSGDTFSRIAQQLYNDESRWVDIAQANPLVDPARLQVGQVIRLPGARQGAAAPPRDAVEAGGGSPRNGVPYTIRAHDTLSSIAQQHYNDPRLWNVIYNANRDVIGGDPDRIPAGRQITIPPAPNGAQ